MRLHINELRLKPHDYRNYLLNHVSSLFQKENTTFTVLFFSTRQFSLLILNSQQRLSQQSLNPSNKKITVITI